MNSTLQRVTDRIRRRSEAGRARYLERIEQAAAAGPALLEEVVVPNLFVERLLAFARRGLLREFLVDPAAAPSLPLPDIAAAGSLPRARIASAQSSLTTTLFRSISERLMTIPATMPPRPERPRGSSPR